MFSAGAEIIELKPAAVKLLWNSRILLPQCQYTDTWRKRTALQPRPYISAQPSSLDCKTLIALAARGSMPTEMALTRIFRPAIEMKTKRKCDTRPEILYMITNHQTTMRLFHRNDSPEPSHCARVSSMDDTAAACEMYGKVQGSSRLHQIRVSAETEKRETLPLTNQNQGRQDFSLSNLAG